MKTFRPVNSINTTRVQIEAQLSQDRARRLNVESRLVALFLLLVILLVILITLDMVNQLWDITVPLSMVTIVPFRLVHHIQLRRIKVVPVKETRFDPELGMNRSHITYATEEITPYHCESELINIDTGESVVETSSIALLGKVLNERNGIIKEIEYHTVET